MNKDNEELFSYFRAFIVIFGPPLIFVVLLLGAIAYSLKEFIGK